MCCVPDLFLRLMIISDREGLQLFQAHAPVAIELDECGRHIGQLEPSSDKQRSYAEPGGNILNAEACADEPVKRLELIGGMHRLADRVFDQAELLGAIGNNFARNRVVLGNLLLLCQRLERGQPAATGHNLIGIGFRFLDSKS